MDNLYLEFGPDEIGELLQYLGAEKPGLSDTQIMEINAAL